MMKTATTNTIISTITTKSQPKMQSNKRELQSRLCTEVKGIDSYALRSTIDYDPIDEIENIKEYKPSYRKTSGKCGLIVYEGGLGTYSAEKNRFYTISQMMYGIDYLDKRFGKHIRFRGRHIRNQVLEAYSKSEHNKHGEGYFEKCDILEIENVWLPLALYLIELCRFYKYDNDDLKLKQSLRRFMRVFQMHLFNRIKMDRSLVYVDTYTKIPHPHLKNIKITAALIYPNILKTLKMYRTIAKQDSGHCIDSMSMKIFGEPPLLAGCRYQYDRPAEEWKLYDEYMYERDKFDEFRFWINKNIRVPSSPILSREDLLYIFDHVYYDFYKYDDRYCT